MLVEAGVLLVFAIAALLDGRLDATWARWSRPWTTLAWSFLTIGIMIGSWWAYYELGWGGWWFWDPVENASFMPWLVGTALIHSLAVTEKRGAFKSWTVLLAITAMLLVAGTALDAAATYFVFLPFLLPVAQADRRGGDQGSIDIEFEHDDHKPDKLPVIFTQLAEGGNYNS